MSSKDNQHKTVNFDATREALLSSPPISKEESNEVWSSLEDETTAQLFLETLSEEKKNWLNVGHDFWELPKSDQIAQLCKLGAMRPFMDEYATPKAREEWFSKHADKTLEDVMVEHLVLDPDGPIWMDDTPTDLQAQF